MNITLRQLEIFLAVAKELHFARAAESLHLSQPTVSQEIRRLERALQVSLFERSTRMTHLTTAGQAILADAQQVHSTALNLVDKAKLFSPAHVRMLRIVASPSAVNRLVPAVISQAEREMPDLIIDAVAVETGDVENRLSAESGDIGFGRFLEAPAGFEHELIAREDVLVAISAMHPLARKRTIDLAELQDLPLLLWSREQNPKYYDALIQICRDRSLTPLILVSPPRIVGTRSYLLAEGRAFSLIPRSAADHLSSDLRAIPLRTPGVLPLEMLYLKHDPRAIVPKFLNVIRAKAQDLRAANEPK